MIAKLLIHPTLEIRLTAIDKILEESELKKDHVDVLWMEEEKLGVEQAKKIRQHLSLKPYSAKGRAIVVLNAQVMTPDAQNSLLKTLEEPPTEAIILLGADSEKKILPTILSRVEKVVIATPDQVRGKQSKQDGEKIASSSDDRRTPRNDIKSLLSSSTEQRFEYIEKLEEKEAFLQELLNYFRIYLSEHPQYPEYAKELMQAEEWAQANGNIRAILEYLMLKMP